MFYFVGLNRFKKRERNKIILALGILIKARAGRYMEFVRYIDIFFIIDTLLWSNTVNIDIQYSIW